MARKKHITENLAAYQKLPTPLLKKNRGKFGLFSGGKLIRVYKNLYDAYKEGFSSYGNGNFFIQEFLPKPVKNGFEGQLVVTLPR